MSDAIPYRLGRDATARDISQSLENNGVAVLGSYLANDDLTSLRDAVTALFDERDQRDLTFGDSSVKRLMSDQLTKALARHVALRKQHEVSLVGPTCDDFFGPARWELGAIYAMRYRDRMPTNEKFHIDPSANVKFFYLSDVTEESGPFTFCLGSHREGYFRMRCSALDGSPGSKVIPENEVRNATPIVGSAGTLVVFNSIGIHRAGALAQGSSRLTVTYHYGAKYERSLRKRIVGKLRGTAGVDWLCAYARKHQSQAYPYTE